MNKTLREIYKTTDFWGILDAIEERLSEGNLQKEHLARMLALQNYWNVASRLISERHSSRLSALENIIACDGIDARLHQPSALEQKPAETEREWMRVPKYNEECWVYYPDGEIHHGHVDDFVKGFTHIMPYHPGDKQPAPPKGDK